MSGLLRSTLSSAPLREGDSNGFVHPGIVLAAAPIYPLAWLLAPAPQDPWIWWWLAATPMTAAAALALGDERVARRFQDVMSACCCVVTFQLFVSASVNDMHPFYSVGSAMAVMGMALFLRTRAWLAGYFVGVAVLCLILYDARPDPLKIAYWGGALPIVLLAYYRLSAQLKASKREREQRALLETLVEERTGELLEANRRLQSEIFQREQLEQEMRVVQKMEAVGRLTGGIAHDFNNLITTITVYSELLRRQLPEGDRELARDVDQITESAQEAAALIQSLLSLSRSGSIETVVLDLNREVAEMADLIGHLLGEHSQLELQLSDDACRIRANTDEIHQVLINLVLNARDAMPKGGTLRIEVSPLESSALRPPELLGASSDSAYVVLIVADDGVGMDEETRQRVFDPFFTTKDANRGTGLGLSTVYGIVSQAGGHVRVSSAPGSGSRFELFFPQTAEPMQPRQTPARPAPAEGGRERILLVEDEEHLRQALHRVLAFSGYRVVEATDGAAALDVMESDAQHFDLVVSDVVMPKMSGIELAERLGHLQPGARVLLLSGYLNHESVEEREFPPSAEFLAKPFSPADLTAKVRNVLDS